MKQARPENAFAAAPAARAPSKSVEYHALHALLQSDMTLMIINAEGIVQYVNPAYESRSGYSAAELIGRTLNRSDFAVHCAQLDPLFFSRLAARAANGESFRSVFAKRGKGGGVYHEEQLVMPVRSSPAHISHYVLTGSHPTSSPPASPPASRADRHEALRGVADRHCLSDALRRRIANARRRPERFALLHIDVDRFRRINDGLGYHVGDCLLAAVAQRIGKLLGANDRIASLGDDEFGVITAEANGPETPGALAEALIGACARPFVVAGQTLYSGISVGISRFPDDGQTAEELLQHAEIAMYRAKASRRGSCVSYSAELTRTMRENIVLESALREALVRSEFTLHYQSIVDTVERRTVAVEALLRWNSAQYGEVSPERFVPLLEDCGLISAVGRWVLQTACRQFSAMQTDAGSPTRLAVNLSAQQLYNPMLVSEIEAVLRMSGLAPQQLELEITENILVDDVSAATTTLHRLAALGVRLAIDDFGTGYSSLSYLRHFPVDTLKIDRSFIDEIETSQDARVITSAIVNLAASLGIDVVAEGVENERQLALLAELGCTRVQGFLFNRPLATSELRRQLALAGPWPPSPQEHDARATSAGGQGSKATLDSGQLEPRRQAIPR